MARTNGGEKKARICSYCNSDDGHNKATCEVRWQLFGFLMDGEQKQTRTCNYCGCSGHDKRNCFIYQVSSICDEDTEPVPTVQVPNTPVGDSVCRHIQFETPVARILTFQTPLTTGRNIVQYVTEQPNTQVVDFDIMDEPWVWAPIRGKVFPHSPILVSRENLEKRRVAALTAKAEAMALEIGASDSVNVCVTG